jgi:hypothetical protein
VRSAEVDGVVVLLDLASASYLALDEVGSDMWRALCEAPDPDAALLAIEERYDVDPARMRSDLEAFAARCRERGLVQVAGAEGGERGERPPARAPARAPSTARAWRVLLSTRRELDRDGLRATYDRAAATPLGEPEASPGTVKRAIDSFLRAENLFLSRRAPKDCLLRSLALFRYLRATGVPVEHRIGAKRFPFGAHAWVEHEGEALLGEGAQASEYEPLARLPA